MRRLPFRSAFYRSVDSRALGSRDLSKGLERDTLLFKPLSSARAEKLFLQLIRLGVLRREVDGQGLTERVRLTPLGREVLELWPGEIPRSGLRRRLLDRIAPLRLRP
jgi:hypothetical protein